VLELIWFATDFKSFQIHCHRGEVAEEVISYFVASEQNDFLQFS
jgi:hypothetical protein